MYYLKFNAITDDPICISNFMLKQLYYSYIPKHYSYVQTIPLQL